MGKFAKIEKGTKYSSGKDLTGMDYGCLHVEEKALINDRAYFRCRCKCGGEILTTEAQLCAGRIKDCGCGMRRKEYFRDGTCATKIRKNIQNKNNKTGHIGVSQIKNSNRWRANIQLQGKNHYLGTYDNLEDAVNARKLAEEKYFVPFLKKIADGSDGDFLKNVGFGGTLTDEEIAALERWTNERKTSSKAKKKRICRRFSDILGFEDESEKTDDWRSEIRQNRKDWEELDGILIDDDDDEEEDFIGFDESFDEE